MAQLRITAVKGLREDSFDEVDHVWGDFLYTEEKERQQTELEKHKAEIKVENETAYEDDFDDEEEEERTKSEDTYDALNAHAEVSSQYTSTEKLDEADGQPGARQKKKGKGRKQKTRSHNKPPPLSLYQDEMKHRLKYTTERPSSHNRDAMSDQEDGRRRGRKLHRRGQMKKYHSLEQAVEQAGRDRLEQKFLELQELMSKPLCDQRGFHSTGQLAPMPNLQCGSSGKGQRQLRPNKRQTGHSISAWVESSVQEEETTDRQAYTTLRKLQTTAPDLHAQTAYHNQSTLQKPADAQLPPRNSRLTSKPPIPRRRKDSVDSSPDSSSRGSRNEEDTQPKHNGFHSDDDDDDDGSKRFGNVSPRSLYLPTDMHLKYSDNPKLQEWLKRKNVEHRQARKAERAKKREERDKKVAELEVKAARREKSSERVKQWMDMKRKEAAKQQREERRRRRQEAQEQAALRAMSSESSVRGNRINRPQSAPTAGKNHIPIRRPESAARLENGAYTAPKPPDSSSKFVYKRPVSGRVRLMKVQDEKNGKSRNTKEKKDEDLSPEEREKKMRLSYDAWLVSKRKEDVEKRKEAKRQENMIKSDPEMERLIPEVAERRIEMIKSAKRSIDTGLNVIDNDANKRFGGGSFREKEKQAVAPSQTEDSTEPSSYNLAVEGSAATLVELNSRARPTSAKTRMPIPQSAFSPRRPQSAKPSRDSSPKVRTIMDTDYMAQPNPYKLPFSDDLGVPHHVRRVQERIFSKQAASQSNGSERPEPQGCASESAACPKDVDDHKKEELPEAGDGSAKSDTTPRASLVLLQQIEEAAILSEQETEQATALGNSTQESEPGVSGSKPDTEAKEASPKETAGDSEERAGVLKTQVTAEADISEKEAEESNESNGAGGDREDCGQELDRSGDQKDGTEGDKDSTAVPEADSQQDIIKSDKSETDVEQQSDHSNQQSDEKGLSNPEKSDDSEAIVSNPESKDPQEDVQDSDLRSESEESPSRSMKRVSFSEDLATVFETTSADTSSNFEDERGMDESEEEHFMSLDDAPDPV